MPKIPRLSTLIKYNTNMSKPTLNRCISLPLLAFYGLGTILGAGIYLLVGKVSIEAGTYAPLSFLLAAILATFTAFSYAELSSRYPKSAGEVIYTEKGLRSQKISQVIGIMVMLTGIVSAATISNGFVGYLNIFVSIESWIVILAFVAFFGLIAIWGVGQSVMLAVIMTIIEIGGLIFVIAIAGDSLGSITSNVDKLIPSNISEIKGIFGGAILAFFAFIGFEDMVKMAEEVKEPKKNMPRGIIIALVASTILYIIIALIAVLALPIDTLTQSDAPLASIVGEKGEIISAISLIAVANGALVQIIMSSRVLYGMSKMNLAPKALGNVNKKTQTPIIATILVIFLVLIFALWLPLITLATITSILIIIVFATINISLVFIKRSYPNPKNTNTHSVIFPIGGFLLSLVFLAFQILQ